MIDSVTSQDMGTHLLIVSSGTVETFEDYLELDSKAAEQFAHSKHRRVIVDERNVKHIDNNVMILGLVERMINELPRELRGVKLALVVGPQSQNLARFWETCCFNRGFNWKSFTDMDEAVAFVESP